jgi:hypothetical protein
LRATDPTDLLIDHFSEKIENQNVSDCVKFIRTAISDNDPQVVIYKAAPKLNFEFGSRFINKFLDVTSQSGSGTKTSRSPG